MTTVRISDKRQIILPAALNYDLDEIQRSAVDVSFGLTLRPLLAS
ncbi:MAG TPA: hypothetical protein VGM19_09435 [Armatimonadota bacterium]|jgi:hypothetical protein